MCDVCLFIHVSVATDTMLPSGKITKDITLGIDSGGRSVQINMVSIAAVKIPVSQPFLHDNLGKLAPERWNRFGFDESDDDTLIMCTSLQIYNHTSNSSLNVCM